ncbi:MAG: hypothetical protein HZB51_20735 [Chloroflexi bacterium]|nr:hypothetical protein [Chloroflexota bacterium]
MAYEKRDFFKQAFTVAELHALLKTLKLTAHDVISTKSPSYKKMNLEAEKLSEEELLALMVQEPRLLRRPLIVVDAKPVVGFDKEKLTQVLK